MLRPALIQAKAVRQYKKLQNYRTLILVSPQDFVQFLKLGPTVCLRSIRLNHLVKRHCGHTGRVGRVPSRAYVRLWPYDGIYLPESHGQVTWHPPPRPSHPQRVPVKRQEPQLALENWVARGPPA